MHGRSCISRYLYVSLGYSTEVVWGYRILMNVTSVSVGKLATENVRKFFLIDLHNSTYLLMYQSVHHLFRLCFYLGIFTYVSF